MPVPMPTGSCAICNGSIDLRARNRDYQFHEPEVVLEPSAGKFKWSESDISVWTPTSGKCPTTAKVLHISGNWKFADFLKACEIKRLQVIEIAPSQKFMLSERILHKAESIGIGIWLRPLKGPQS
jgi:hypothetical protein